MNALSIPEEIGCNRRSFLRSAAMSIAAVEFAVIGSAEAESSKNKSKPTRCRCRQRPGSNGGTMVIDASTP